MKAYTDNSGYIQVKNQDMWLMLMSTMRYSFRRMTYMPSTLVDMVSEYQEALETHQLEQMKRETLEELKIEEGYPGTIGMKCDVQTWKNFVQVLDDILEKRKA